MILHGTHVSYRLAEDVKHASESHHRLVKTTPKPRATKNNKGELVGPLLPLPLPLLPLVEDGIVVGVTGVYEDVVADMVANSLRDYERDSLLRLRLRLQIANDKVGKIGPRNLEGNLGGWLCVSSVQNDSDLFQ